MQAFVIEGGRPLGGTIRAAGNKNGALPILAACALATEPVQLTNVPRIRDVQTMMELLGLELDEHIANVVAALQPISRELGLRTAADAA